ncbi:tetratricopeptide repeat protein [Leptolyngbya sp. PCC 6406]|uniref:tetratricopeptide repeat protein n=1 Tax=Leptolyngbya sp. PCC 6406 TaxID=1173264 RepID=UPI0002ABAB75|nr:tetratricopeptide repeat protein [Leptolyngbya sp. PCC 6406]
MDHYGMGQDAFERGNYREAVAEFEQAVKLANPNGALGGEISLWLVNAYAAANQQEKAVALCKVLTRHPDLDTRQQGKRLLYILNAPRLKLKEEWQTRIPDLSDLAEDRDRTLNLSQYAPPTRSQPRRPEVGMEPEDLSQINTRDNGFLWLALTAIALLIGGLSWWA